MPEVSYILTTKDRPEQARNFLKNLTALKREGDEVIIVEASEEPYSPEIFGGVATKVITEKDRNMAHGLNRGILASTKSYIKLLMDDDWFLPDEVHRAFSIMEEHGVHAMQTGGKRWTEPNHPADIGMYDCIVREVGWGSHPSQVVTYGATGVGQFFAREAFAIGGLLNTKWAAWDMEIMARMIAWEASVRYCRLYTYEHPITPTSTLGDPSRRTKLTEEVATLRRMYGVDIDGLDRREWKHMTYEAAKYDGGFS